MQTREELLKQVLTPKQFETKNFDSVVDILLSQIIDKMNRCNHDSNVIFIDIINVVKNDLMFEKIKEIYMRVGWSNVVYEYKDNTVVFKFYK